MRILAAVLLIILAVGCAGQGGQVPQRAAPQPAKIHAQPTIRPLGQFPNAQQPTAATPTLDPLIKERPLVRAATPTPQPGQGVASLEDAQNGAVNAQTLVDDCIELATREAALGWVVDCKPLHDNLAEANRRLSERMAAAISEDN